MFKVGILGAESKQAGELIRVLMQHPEVESIVCHSEGLEGKNLGELHHGLIGENKRLFMGFDNIEECDVVFIASNSARSDSIDQLSSKIKLIDLRGLSGKNIPNGYEYGLSELNRKRLVRGATKAVTASPLAVPVLIALYPLARNLLLIDDIEVEYSIPVEMRTQKAITEAKKEIEDRLGEIQLSYKEHSLRIISSNNRDARAIKVRINIPLSIDIDQLKEIYDDLYNDHNFTFVLTKQIDENEVAGTNKCLISLYKPSDNELSIEVFTDGRLRGGAGEGVHLMNLLQGLHEKTGLYLKTSNF